MVLYGVEHKRPGVADEWYPATQWFTRREEAAAEASRSMVATKEWGLLTRSRVITKEICT